ncbi:hypothetical protein G6O69_16335 [Pseudenhygromyxa sp. WMMC2535]|uniref:hypothetical protein n=1 Tax=Pseudenhygromyxa sp. WMMC2535 TaxID=2712867 RepID=UPI0015533A7B|nr:hypothetical protein [Pseudenhygromyxa sp. WMMC2535]NVB39412.1 hypothetical protein [Pseudenhygromyxa sp. WMMC2535]
MRRPRPPRPTMAALPRPWLALAALVLAPGCGHGGQAPAEGSRGSAPSAGATSQADATRSQTSQGAHHGARASSATGGRSSTPTQLIAVVGLDSAQAGVCERLCGRVSDCLVDKGSSRSSASHLELSCLSICATTEDPAGQEFRGCEAEGQCDPLLACAHRHWRDEHTLATTVDYAVQDPCRLTCEGLYSCMYFNTPRGSMTDSSGDEQYRRDVQSCLDSCDPSDPFITGFAACTDVSNCTEQWECSSLLN